MEDSAEGAGSGDINARLANRRRGKGTGNPGKPGKKLRLADLQSQFGVGLKVLKCQLAVSCGFVMHTVLHCRTVVVCSDMCSFAACFAFACALCYFHHSARLLAHVIG